MKWRWAHRFLTASLCIACLSPTPAKGWFDGDFDLQRHYLESENVIDLLAYRQGPFWPEDWLTQNSG